MKKQMTLAFAIVGLSAFAATYDETTGYVTMSGTDSTGAANLFNSATSEAGGAWSDGREPHPETNYFVGAGQTLYTPGSTTAESWQGGQLVIGDGGSLRYTSKANPDLTIGNLLFLPGGKFVYARNVMTTLHGTLTVEGTETTPSLASISSIAGGHKNAMAFVGSSSSFFDVKFVNEADGVYTISGDLSRYQGTIFVESKSKPSAGFTQCLRLDSASLPGTLKLNPALVVRFYSAVSIGTLDAADGAVLEWPTIPADAATDSMTLTISKGLICAGSVILKLTSAGFSGATEQDHVLIRVLRDAAEGLDEDALLPQLDDDLMAAVSKIEWRDGADGCRELHLLIDQTITYKKSIEPKTAFPIWDSPTNSAGQAYWSDGSTPEAGKSYYVQSTKDNTATVFPTSEGTWTFPGRTFFADTLNISLPNTVSAAKGLRIDDWHWKNGTMLIYGVNAGTGSDPVLKTRVVTIAGNLYTYSGGALTFRTYGSLFSRYDCNISGGGALTVTTYGNASSASSNNGNIGFFGDNSGFGGKIVLTQETSSKEYTEGGVTFKTPTDKYCVSLHIDDGRALGGSCGEAFAYDALTIEQYAKLVTRDNDVTLADGLNRGILINGNGRFAIPAGLTLTVNRPITVNGRMRKTDAGTLVLGNALRFGDGETTTAPVADANEVSLEGGTLRIANARALDGAAVELAAGTVLAFEPIPEDEDLRTLGVVNTRGAFAAARFAVDGAIALSFGKKDQEAPEGVSEFTTGIVTLPTESEALAFKAACTGVKDNYRAFKAVLDVRENANGTWTVFAKSERKGLMILFR